MDAFKDRDWKNRAAAAKRPLFELSKHKADDNIDGGGYLILTILQTCFEKDERTQAHQQNLYNNFEEFNYSRSNFGKIDATVTTDATAESVWWFYSKNDCLLKVQKRRLLAAFLFNEQR